ncbi:MAG TPA: acyltransferase family protein [Rhizomicrobium sp.]|jgi:peptidoglycan/LPS O-acetylase OafA/YrhL|nr:acyltransferase family protein [Rhizomicrobium sp.]
MLPIGKTHAQNGTGTTIPVQSVALRQVTGVPKAVAMIATAEINQAPAVQAHPDKGHTLPHYRPDIDGLRALAVLPVVFWHYGVWPFRGGFVGVDVFFVISGFLITSLIHAEIKADTFSIAYFYERRIRRIFPALFAVLLATIFLAALLLFPSDLKRYAQSLQATVLFGSNFLFRNLAGYWDVVSERKPLLHTWSLAVEEQFYLLFPLTLYLLTKAGRKVEIGAIVAILALSLAANVWAVRATPVSDFFLLPYRAWELMLGSLLSIVRFPAPSSRVLRETVMLAGLGLIALAVFAYSADTPFPGEAAIVPCLGAALLIYAGADESTVASTLRLRPVVAVGLISYSLYLWHWPLLVFAKYALFRELTPLETGALIALAVVCAGLSWRFVEQPFRGHRERFSRRQIFLLGGAATLIALLLGALLQMHSGWPQRFSPEVRAIFSAARRSNPPKELGCIDRPTELDADAITCTFGTPGPKPTIALWGDSHAAVILPVVAEAAIRARRAGLFARHHGCAPLLGVESSRAHGCQAFNDRIVRQIERDADIRVVILLAHWAESAEGVAYGHNDAGDLFLTDAQSPVPSLPNDPAVFTRGLDRTVAALTRAGKKVVIIASIPEIGWPVPETLARMKLAHHNGELGPTLAQYLARQRTVFAALAQMQHKYGVTVGYPHGILCRSGRCNAQQNGTPLYVDAHHLNYRGALLLTPLLDRLLSRP